METRRALAILIGFVVCGSGCMQPPAGPRRVQPSYDDFTRRLIRLAADHNGDGRADQWTYLDGNRTLRGEADTDADDRIDRWEYFGANGELTAVGTSSLNDGVEDTWSIPAADGEAHIARSTRRDRMMDRHEYQAEWVAAIRSTCARLLLRNERRDRFAGIYWGNAQVGGHLYRR